MNHIISPSILSADFMNLQSEIEFLNQSQAEWIHIDVMDGVFVPNITFGFPIIKQIRQQTKKVLDVHLMITQPERYISEFKEAGADVLTVHYEACTHLHRTIQEIKANGMKAGVSIVPHVGVSVLEDIIEELDLVLIMSVNPGFGGQKFIENTYKKVKQTSDLIKSSHSKALIQIDGGVNDQNAKKLVDSGADVLVAGNFIFKSENKDEQIRKLL